MKARLQTCFRTLCIVASLFVATSAMGQDESATRIDQAELSRRIDALAPDVARAADIVPNGLRFVGYDRLEGDGAVIRGGRDGTLRLYFENRSLQRNGLDHDIIFILDGIDVARLPVRGPFGHAGEVFSREIAFHVPRYVAPGRRELAVAAIPSDSPGQRTDINPAGLIGHITFFDLAEPTTPDFGELRPAKPDLPRDSNNLIENGSFEDGFRAWEMPPGVQSGISGWRRLANVERDASIAAEGRTSLRLDFPGGQDPNFYHISQSVACEPQTAYVLSYYLLTAGLTSHSGVSVTAQARGNSALAAPQSEETFSAPGEWRRVDVPVTTGDSGDVLIRIRRFGSGSGRFEPDKFGVIGGSAWLDAITLTPAP